MDVIDAYLDELTRRLRGPRRVRADLLAEARDALCDAADGYECAGRVRSAAEAQAVAEFGVVDELAPQYQAELAFAQGRRTAITLLFVLIGQSVAWQLVWPVVRPAPVADPTPMSAALGSAVSWLAGAAVAGALIAILACGVGVRRLSATCGPVIRATGALALAVAASLTVLSLVLGLAAPRTGSVLTLSVGLPWALAFLVIPMAGVAMSGRRCLAVAP